MFKGTFSLSCVSGALKGTLRRPQEMAYTYINDSGTTITHNKVELIAVFCDSIVQGSVNFP